MIGSSEERDFFLGLELRKELGIGCPNAQGVREHNDRWPRCQGHTPRVELLHLQLFISQSPDRHQRPVRLSGTPGGRHTVF